MPRFLHVVRYKWRFDSSTDQEERARVEYPVAVGHLQDTNFGLSVTKCRGETTNVLSCLSRSRFREEQLRSQISTVDVCFVRDTYLNLAKYYSLTPPHLE